MPKLLDHPQEMDRVHTPMEARRRSLMNVRNTQYGFYTVPNGPIEPMICNNCGREIVGQALNINGNLTHYTKCE